MAQVAPSSIQALTDVATTTPGLALLLLFGSRARADASEHSDWDFGYIAAEELDVPALLASLVTTLDTDRVDLVDLARASGLLRFRAAREGQVIFEACDGLADRFRLEAATFWFDAEPVLRRGYERLLAELPR